MSHLTRLVLRFASVAILVSILALLVTACAGDSGSGDDAAPEDTTAADDRSGGPLIVNMNTGPASLDPAGACSFFDTVSKNFYVRLVDYGTKEGPDGTQEFDPNNIVPYFAESWDVSGGGRVYTFKLPSGVTFPSGAPVDAEAVKYSFERALVAPCGSYFLVNGIPGNIEGIEAPDPTTVVITLKQPDPYILQGWAQPAGSIVDPSVVDEHGGIVPNEIDEYMSSNVAGSGPYLLKEYQPNEQLVLERNPDFFGDPPASEEIILNFINSDSTLLLQARSGQADITIGMSKQSVNSLEGADNVRVVVNDTTISEQIILPWNKPPFDNLKVREAVTYAVPYEDILERVAFGYGELFYGPLPPLMPLFNPDVSQPREFNLERAQQLMEESGVETPVAVEITIDEGNAVHEQIATIMQGVWRDLGINVTIIKLAAADYSTALFSNEVQSAIRFDGPGVIDAGYLLGYDMRCEVVGIGINLSAMCMEEADALLDEARQTADEQRRQELFDEITEIWRANSPKIPVYAEKAPTVLSDSVTSYVYNQEPDFTAWAK